jgi:hypothetical protein
MSSPFAGDGSPGAARFDDLMERHAGSDPAVGADEAVLYRIVTSVELESIRLADRRRLPALPEWQPILYAWLDLEDVLRGTRFDADRRETAHVIRLRVRPDAVAPYELRWVAGRIHYRIPSEALPHLNEALVGPIEVVEEEPRMRAGPVPAKWLRHARDDPRRRGSGIQPDRYELLRKEAASGF